MSDSYAALAAELRALADGLESLSGTGLADVSANMTVHFEGGQAARVAGVDAVGRVVLGVPGNTRKVCSALLHVVGDVWTRERRLRLTALTGVDTGNPAQVLPGVKA